MTRTTIDFGIDLGTTNSAIGVMADGKVELIKNGNSDVLPSCVYIDKKGNLSVGARAKGRLGDWRSTSDVHVEFKRQMGMDQGFHFESSNQTLSPEELSAEVLKSLLRAAAVRFGGDPPTAAVVTIPAMFESPQRAATAKACKLAGLDHVELLQEPVAAAVAHGFRSDSENTFWLVFDLGGGTFDTSIVAIRDGALTVVEHAGDNFLGGADFDWALVEEILIPKLSETYDLSHLNRRAMGTDANVRAAMYRLKLQAEEIKIELTQQDSIEYFREDVLKDANGADCDIDLVITRAEFDAVVRPLVERAISISSALIERAGLKPSNIEKILPVGGGTFMPIVQTSLSELGIAVDRSIDPLTVVASGAASFAASRRLPESATRREAGPVDGLSLTLEYKPVTRELESLIGGRAESSDGTVPDGLALSIDRADGGWTSGNVSIEEGGVFFANVVLEKGAVNEFVVSAFTADGRSMEVSPERFTITHGLTVSGASLPNTIRLCKADGSTQPLIAKGTQLPATSTRLVVSSTIELRKDSDAKLFIPFCEGDEDLANRNLEGSQVTIHGADIDRTIPKGTEIHVSAEVDVSGIATYNCFVPILDETFEATSEQLNVEKPEAQRRKVERVEERIREIRSKAAATADSEAVEALSAITHSGRIEAIETDIDAHEGGDTACAGRARNELVALENDLDELEAAVSWPADQEEYRRLCEEARKLVHANGDANDREALKHIESEAKRALDEANSKMLVAATDNMRTLCVAISMRDPRMWIAMLANLSEQVHEFSDRAGAEALLRQGARAVRSEDIDTLQSVVRQLMSMLPSDVAAEVEAGGIVSHVR